jgi:hypothetical protein
VSFCGVTQFAADETFIGLVRFMVVFVPSPKSATEINVGETNEASVGIGCTSATFTTNIVWIPNHQRYFCAAVRTELALWNAKPEFESPEKAADHVIIPPRKKIASHAQTANVDHQVEINATLLVLGR